MRLTTARLSLREFGDGDASALHAIEADSEAVKYVSYGPSTEEECRQDLAFHIEHQTAQSRIFYHLAVCLQKEPQMIGCTNGGQDSLNHWTSSLDPDE